MSRRITYILLHVHIFCHYLILEDFMFTLNPETKHKDFNCTLPMKHSVGTDRLYSATKIAYRESLTKYGQICGPHHCAFILRT